MRSSEKKPAGTDRQVKTIRGKGKRAGDADSKRLQKIAKQIGNDVLTKHLNQKGADKGVGFSNVLSFSNSFRSTLKQPLNFKPETLESKPI